ncbi:MAG: NUDIX hydrolase [Deltaproteobacteria bacterium]|nr:NUDIX hydrolase [Deltaproteobacteria bacterium]
MEMKTLEKDSLFSKNGGRGEGKQAPRDAATVILLRDRTEGPYEVFLMRRHRDQVFMGGAYVFPGGRLDDADADPELAACIGGFRAADAKRLLQETDLPEAAALGLFLAAIRETFEEAGVLLARDTTGRLVDLADPETAARFSTYRLELHEERLTLAELVRREGLIFAPDLLIPYAHWITPEIESRRFDTRFFLARLPEGQVPVHDRMELTESSWMTPAFALAENEAGRIILMPPTLKTIEELLSFSNTAQLFAAARSQRIRTILPEAFRTADGFGIRLPHDSEYTLAACKQLPHPGGSTRIVMEGGIWKARSV